MGLMTQSHQPRRPRPGRPRHIESSPPTADRARDEVLDVAARLFTEQGFAATSTRHIADAVGIRQASLYYHFPSKDHILTEVLAQTIRPTLENVDVVEDMTDDPATALYLLVLLDVRTLAKAPHNSGLLGLLPDVAKLVPEFGKARAELAAEYARIGAEVASRPVTESVSRKQLGDILLTNVESVIGWISDRSFTKKSGDVVATSCLRMCGADEDTIVVASLGAHALLAEVAEEVA